MRMCMCMLHVRVTRVSHVSESRAQACRPRLSQAPSTATRRSAARARDLLPRQPRALVPRAAASPAALGTRALAGESAAARERVARSTVRRPVAAASVARLVEDVEGLPGSAMARQGLFFSDAPVDRWAAPRAQEESRSRSDRDEGLPCRRQRSPKLEISQSQHPGGSWTSLGGDALFK